MPVPLVVSSSRALNGAIAASHGASLINAAISKNGFANVILATGASQFEMLGRCPAEGSFSPRVAGAFEAV